MPSLAYLTRRGRGGQGKCGVPTQPPRHLRVSQAPGGHSATSAMALLRHDSYCASVSPTQHIRNCPAGRPPAGDDARRGLPATVAHNRPASVFAPNARRRAAAPDTCTPAARAIPNTRRDRRASACATVAHARPAGAFGSNHPAPRCPPRHVRPHCMIHSRRPVAHLHPRRLVTAGIAARHAAARAPERGAHQRWGCPAGGGHA